MKNQIKDGGPAFPCSIKMTMTGGNMGGEEFEVVGARPTPVGFPGMTLRDWFAGQALAGYLASYGPGQIHPMTRGAGQTAAEEAYYLADAMLAAREAKS